MACQICLASMPLGHEQLFSGALHDQLYLSPAVLLAEEVLVPLQPALPTTQRLQEHEHVSAHSQKPLKHTDAGERVQLAFLEYLILAGP